MKRLILSFLLLIALWPFSGKAQQNCGLSVQGVVKNASCSGGMDGAIRLQVNGGAKPYTFNWSDGQEVKDISQLTEGTYTITVRDGQGCISKAVFSIKSEQGEVFALRVEQQPAGRGKVLKIAFQNGRKPYATNIKRVSDGIRAPFNAYTGQSLSAGTYSVEAFTEAGCSIIERVKIDAN